MREAFYMDDYPPTPTKVQAALIAETLVDSLAGDIRDFGFDILTE